MNVRTFHAATMAQALAQVRKEMGPHTVILHTRTIRRGGVFGIGARTLVELTAADAAEVGRQRRKAQLAAAAAALPRRPVTPRPAMTQATAPVTPRSNELAGDLIRRTYAAARAELAPAQAQTSTQTPQPLGADASRLTEEMQAVKRMVARMMRQQRTAVAGAAASPSDVPDKLFDQYLALLKQEVAEELAEEIVADVRQKLASDELADEQAVRRAVHEAVSGLIPTDTTRSFRVEPTSDGRPRTVALIGPTGVGKTTTVAKLAATFKLKQKKSVGLITLDTYRIAAVDQLRTYANIIGVPLHVVTTAQELRSAMADLKRNRCDVVLIDTAGRSQRDDPKLDQLQALIEAADPHEVHLVLSSTASQSVLLETAARFSRIRADRIIFTKLDEAVSFGVLLNVARKVNKQLSYVTTGQEVPHQIEAGSSKRLASLILGDKA